MGVRILHCNQNILIFLDKLGRFSICKIFSFDDVSTSDLSDPGFWLTIAQNQHENLLIVSRNIKRTDRSQLLWRHINRWTQLWIFFKFQIYGVGVKVSRWGCQSQVKKLIITSFCSYEWRHLTTAELLEIDIPGRQQSCEISTRRIDLPTNN